MFVTQGCYLTGSYIVIHTVSLLRVLLSTKNIWEVNGVTAQMIPELCRCLREISQMLPNPCLVTHQDPCMVYYIYIYHQNRPMGPMGLSQRPLRPHRARHETWDVHSLSMFFLKNEDGDPRRRRRRTHWLIPWVVATQIFPCFPPNIWGRWTHFDSFFLKWIETTNQ